MTPMSQPDLHPDADLLNAFVERALPQAERARIVAHMAGCARCREVVYLAQAAAEPEIAPVAVVKPPARPGWFYEGFAKWRVALIPAAALAAVGGVVFWVQLHPAPPPTEMAKLDAQSAPVPATPAPAASQQALPKTAPEPPDRNKAITIPPAPIVGPKPKKAPAGSSGAIALDQLARRDSAAAPAFAPAMEPGRAVDGIHLDGRSASMARFSSPAQPASPQPTLSFTPPLGGAAEQQRFEQAIGGPALTSVAPAPAPPDIVALHGTAPPASLGESPGVLAVSPQTLNKAALFQLARRAKLPSGLKTVSSAAMLNRLVAVDSAGSVFLSQDAGRHWEPVLPQWSGKALQVLGPPPSLYRLSATDPFEVVAGGRLSAPVSGEGIASRSSRAKTTAAQPAASNAPAPGPVESGQSMSGQAIGPPPASAEGPPIPANSAGQATLFKLVTDRQQVWISDDGKIWREQ